MRVSTATETVSSSLPSWKFVFVLDLPGANDHPDALVLATGVFNGAFDPVQSTGSDDDRGRLFYENGRWNFMCFATNGAAPVVCDAVNFMLVK